MANILFIPKSQEELEMIKEFALRNGLSFTFLTERQSEGESKPYIEKNEAPLKAEETASVYKPNKKEPMEQVVVDINTENDMQYIEQVLSEKGISFRKQEDVDFQQRMRARQILAEASKSWPSYDISMEEITAMVKEARAERYAGKQGKDNH